MSDREDLSRVICDVTDRWDEPLDEVHDVPQIVNAVLAWLADHDRRVSERTWGEGHQAAALRIPEGVWAATAEPHSGNPYRVDPADERIQP
jgi:hypothetical protein